MVSFYPDNLSAQLHFLTYSYKSLFTYIDPFPAQPYIYIQFYLFPHGYTSFPSYIYLLHSHTSLYTVTSISTQLRSPHSSVPSHLLFLTQPPLAHLTYSFLTLFSLHIQLRLPTSTHTHNHTPPTHTHTNINRFYKIINLF